MTWSTQDLPRSFLQSTCQVTQESCKNHAKFYAMIYWRFVKIILTEYLPGHARRFVKIILTKYLPGHAGILQESCKILCHDLPKICQDYSYRVTCQIMQESGKNLARFYAMIYWRFVKIILTKYLPGHAGILQESCKILCHDLPKICQDYSYRVTCQIMQESCKNLDKILIRWTSQDLSYIILLKLVRSQEILQDISSRVAFLGNDWKWSRSFTKLSTTLAVIEGLRTTLTLRAASNKMC